MTSGRFVGRTEELARLDAALARVRSGEPAGLVIGGEAGIGKTRLVREFAGRAADGGVRMLWGSCPAVEGSVAFAPLVEALRPLVREFAGPMLEWLVGEGRAELGLLLPEVADGEATERAVTAADAFGQARLFARILELLERLAGEEPVAVVVEDLHWADRSTRQLLSFLARNLRAVPVMLVGTYRTDGLRADDPLRGFLLDLDHSRTLERVELPRLSEAEVRGLLEGVLGVPPAARVSEAIIARCDGNAFFAEELLAVMRRGGGRVLPPTLRDLLLHRVEGLGGLARRALATAAVAGCSIDHRLLAAVADLDEAALLAGVGEAVEANLLIPDADGRSYAFRHALTQEAVYGELPAGERLRLHATVAETLEARPYLAGSDVVAALAQHWDAAGVPERALAARVAAGRAAEAVYGFAEAQQHFARAAALWREVRDPPADLGLDRVGLLDRAARAANHAGDHPGAAGLLAEALAEADAVRAAELEQQLGLSRFLAGDEAAGLAGVRAALQRLPADAPPRIRAGLLAFEGVALMVHGDYAAARPSCEEAIAIAGTIGAGAIEARARNGLGPVLGADGEVEAAIETLTQARALAEAAGDVEELLRSYVNLGATLGFAGRFEDAVEASAEGAARAAELGGERWHGAVLHNNRAASLMDLGRWDEAGEALASALALAPDGATGVSAHLGRALLATAQGRFAAAERALEAAWRCGDVGPVDGLVRAALALERGDAAAARAAAAAVLAAGDDPRGLHTHGMAAELLWLGLRAEADLIEAAAPLGRDAEVAERRCNSETLRARSERLDARTPVERGYVALCAGEWSRAQQRPDDEVWAAAVACWDALGVPYRAAYARWRQAEALAAARAGAAEVAEPLRAAHATAAALGAVPLHDALGRLAVRTRTTLTVAAPDTAPAPPGPADQLGLTRREQEVLALLAEGLSNPQIGKALFISAKTASVHVSNILRKLDVAGRGQAAAVAHRLGLGAGATTDDPSRQAR